MKQRVDEKILSEIKMVNTPQFSPSGKFISYFEEWADLEENKNQKHLLCRDMISEQVHVVPAEKVKFSLWRGDDQLYLFTTGPNDSTFVLVWNPILQKIENRFSLPNLTGAKFYDDSKMVILAPYCELSETKGYLSITQTPFWVDGRGFVNGKRNRLGICHKDSSEITWITSSRQQVSNWILCNDTVYYTAVTFTSCLSEKKGLFSYCITTGETKILIPEGLYYIETLFQMKNLLYFFGSDGKRYGRHEYGGFYQVDTETSKVSLWLPYDANVGASSIYSDSINSNGQKYKVWNDQLYFITSWQEASRIRVLTSDKTIKDVVCDAKAVTAFDISHNNMVYVGCYDMEVAELYQHTLDKSENREDIKLTNYSQHILDKYHLSIPQAIYITDRDGTRVNGWVMQPQTLPEGEKVPLILYVHGGPRMTFSDCFVAELQCLTSRGFGVCYCNPVGSDSRGNEYGNISGRYGDIDYHQIMEFVKKVLEKYPCFDEKKVGILGGSYGGYMVNWTIGHTQFFKAAVSERSIANWITLESLSDIGAFYVPDQAGKSLMNDEVDQLWDNSPLKYAKNVVTPTLFIQSERDFRCPREETFQMFYQLIKRGIPTKVLYFMGENHGLCRRGAPQNRAARILEIAHWFSQYLFNTKTEE